MFNLYVDLIIYSMAQKISDGELSPEVVFVFVFSSVLPFLSNALLISSATFALLRFSVSFGGLELERLRYPF